MIAGGASPSASLRLCGKISAKTNFGKEKVKFLGHGRRAELNLTAVPIAPGCTALFAA
jgi:hypothetical protein